MKTTELLDTHSIDAIDALNILSSEVRGAGLVCAAMLNDYQQNGTPAEGPEESDVEYFMQNSLARIAEQIDAIATRVVWDAEQRAEA